MLFIGKRKSNGVGGWLYLLIKQCVHIYMHVVFVLTFVLNFCLFVVKKFYVLEFNNCACKFDKNKNLCKKKTTKFCFFVQCYNIFLLETGNSIPS